MRRRSFVAASVVLVSAASGCSGRAPASGTTADESTDTPTPTADQPTDTPTPRTNESTDTPTPRTDESTDAPASTAPDHEPAATQFDPDLPILVENRHDEEHVLTITVIRGRDGEAVHDSSHDVAAGEAFEAYNLRAADPDGIESFGVAIELGDHRESLGVRTDECHGRVVAGIDGDGDLTATYSVC